MPKKTKLKNSNKMDMINGPIWNKLPRFALPVAATAILEQLFNASDLAVVGNFTGAAKTASVAAVGANSPVIGLILNLFIGIALGTNVIIANAIGRDDRETVQRAVHTSVLTAIIGGFLVMIPCEIFAVQILSVMSIPEDVLPYAVLYLRIYLLGLPVILLYNFLSAVFRSVGDTKTPLIVLALSGCLNVLLNLFFVIVLKMTVNGVAIATVISNAISSIVLFIVLMKSDKYIKLSLRELRIDKRVLGQILEIGLPAGIQSAVFAISNIIIQAAINSLGTIVIAASSAAFNIEVIAYDVFNSFSQACTTFVGQNYGAGKARPLQENPASVDCGGHNRNSRHNRTCSFLGTIPALDIHKRPTGNRARLHQTFTDFLGIHVFNALRNYVGVSSRLRHILGTGYSHNNRRLRHKSILDIRRFPVVTYLQNHYVCVPDKPVAYGGTDIYSSARLSPVAQV